MRVAYGDAALVPFVERVRGMQLSRTVMTLAVIAGPGLDLTAERLSLLTLGIVEAAYLLLTAVTLLAPRMRRSWGIALSGVALLLDGIFLAVTTYGLTGFANPLVVLLLLHAVAVTLLSSFRTGLKVAAWHTLLMAATYQMHQAGMLALPAQDRSDVVVMVGALWLLTLATASFAAVNEREIRRRSYDLLALTRLSLRLESSMRPADVGRALLTAVRDDQGVGRAVLLEAVGGRLERLVGHDDTPVLGEGLDAGQDVMIGRAVSDHRTLRVPVLDPVRDPWLATALPGARNIIVVPLYADGAVAGVLAAEHASARGSRVEARVLRMLEQYASHAALAMTNARLLAQMRQLADTDGLTGVANRRTFDRVLVEELATAADQHGAIAVVLADLDHFKQLNDTFGHQEGDAVLRGAAQAFSAACRPSDLVARYGGEEFAVVLPGADTETARALAERLRGALAQVTVGDGVARVTVSMGVAVSCDGRTAAEELLAVADAALYRSKRGGRDRTTVDEVGRAVAV